MLNRKRQKEKKPKYTDNYLECIENYGIYIPTKTRLSILKHIVINMTITSIENYPLIYILSGEPGTGKTFSLKKICQNINCKLFHLAASELAGKYESDSKEVISKKYQDAHDYVKMNKAKAVIVIEDIHLSTLSALSGTNISGTVNSGLLLSELMDIADKSANEFRIPIFLTTNSLKKIPSTLKRNQRCVIHEMVQDECEKKLMIRALIEKELHNIKYDQLDEIINSFSKEPIAFWADVVSFYITREIDEFLYKLEFQPNRSVECITEIENKISDNRMFVTDLFSEIARYTKKNDYMKNKTYLVEEMEYESSNKI